MAVILTGMVVGLVAESPATATTLPTTSALIPVNGAVLSGTAVTLDASASNATSVEFLLFGGTYGYAAPMIGTATPTNYGWVSSWNTTTVPDGSYALVSEAFNSAGSTFSTGISITVDNPLPTTRVLIPSNATTLIGSTFLDASASNATSVEFLLFGGTYGYAAPVICTATPTIYGWLCAWNPSTVPDGSYVLVSEAFNSVGTAFSSGVNITNTTAVDSWGDGSFSDLGNGTSSGDQPLPAPISGLNDVEAISAGGGSFSLALLTNGTVESWGLNSEGELGNGTTVNSDTPVMVSGLSQVQAISAGVSFSLALLRNGTVEAWGEDGFGNLGTGTITGPETCSGPDGCSTTPVAVPGLSGVKAISAGSDFSLAVLTNGTVEAWGFNGDGELGIGTDTGPDACGPSWCSDVPVPVSGLAGVSSVAAGAENSLASLTNGTVDAWGDNSVGELGGGSTKGVSTTPVVVPGLTGIDAVAAGYGKALALTNEGDLYGWGLGITTPELTLSGVKAMSTSSGNMLDLALLDNGTVDSWGFNGYGELGNGTIDGSSDPPPPSLTTPGPVSGLTGVVSVSAGGQFGLALT